MAEPSEHVDSSAPEAPPRPLGVCEPLITAAEVYPVLEREALRAEREIRFWFRIFDPHTPLVADESRARGLETWGDLIAARVRDGVAFAIAHSDFDAVAATDLHAAAHRHVGRLSALELEGGLSILIAEHGARAGRRVRALAWPFALLRVEQLRRDLQGETDPEAALAARPGLRRWLRARDGQLVWRGFGPPAAIPATHHQKIATFDGARAVIGGLDVDRRRWDTPEHRRAAPNTWRDLSVLVDGPVAADIDAHLARCWNSERDRLGRQDLPALDSPPTNGPKAGEGAPSIRLSTTFSAPPGPAPDRISPRTVERGLERDYLAMIRSARRHLYIETQFLRSRKIAKAIVRQARLAPELRLIVTLPAAPEDVAFDHATGLGARYGEWLQGHAVRKIRRAYGPRCAVVSPARPVRRDADDRSVLDGAGIVYVHTKAMIRDDEAAMVSSANLNGRSLRWDTEAGVVVESRDHARDLRRKLWGALLGTEAPAEALDPETAPKVWADLAAANKARPPAARDGFLLPYDAGPALSFGAPAPGAPEEIV